MSEPTESCRADVWLWRARFFKTRALAAIVLSEGGVRLSRGVLRSRLDKPSRPVRPGDVLTLARGEGWVSVRIEALGHRRGPPSEARALYILVEPESG